MPADAAAPAHIEWDVGWASSRSYDLRYGLDMDGNGGLDDSELWPLPPPGKPLLVRGYSTGAYAAALTTISGGYHVPYDIAAPLLQLFYECKPDDLQEEAKPASTLTEAFNCFGDDFFSKWLTHNAGQIFGDDGWCSIEHYTWKASYVHSPKIARSDEIKDRVRRIYATHRAEIAAYFEDKPVGHRHTFPAWDEGGTDLPPVFGFGGLANDLAIAFGRVRVDTHAIEVAARKTKSGIAVLLITSSGVISDLYDFNILGGFPANVAAMVELGYGTGRLNGQIYKDTFLWEYDWTDPNDIRGLIRP
jgi:hypothetical protein